MVRLWIWGRSSNVRLRRSRFSAAAISHAIIGGISLLFALVGVTFLSAADILNADQASRVRWLIFLMLGVSSVCVGVLAAFNPMHVVFTGTNCPGCGYDVHDDYSMSRCPECGFSIRRLGRDADGVPFVNMAGVSVLVVGGSFMMLAALFILLR